MIHQGTYSYFTGGFNSFMLIWFGILPMLAGIISGRKAVIFWSTLTTLCAGTFLYLDQTEFQFPMLITPIGELWSRILIVFGWIFLSTSITYVILILNESKEKLLSTQSKKIEDLFRVLFHDLAGPLSRSSVGLSIAKREPNVEDKNQGIEIASTAIDSMLDITQNIREMYAIYKEQVETKLVYYSLNDAIKNILDLYETPLKEKDLHLIFDFKKHEGLKVLVEPVSFKNQVLGNAISNAIKFSKPSSQITIRAYPLDDKIMAIEIVDEGIGMPVTILDSLFRLNKKVSRPGTLGEPGTGHGMHIMKSFMDLYKGDIQVLSKDEAQNGHGTIVKLLLTGKWPGERTLPS